MLDGAARDRSVDGVARFDEGFGESTGEFGDGRGRDGGDETGDGKLSIGAEVNWGAGNAVGLGLGDG